MQEKEPQVSFYEFLDQAPEELNHNLETNLSMRMKFPTETDKFYSTQESINDILTTFEVKLEQVEQQPYQVINRLLNSKILLPLLKTLEHPNLDINISAVNCIYSLTVEMNQQIEQAQKDQRHDSKKATDAYAMFFRMNVWMIQNGLVQNLFKIMSTVNQQKLEQYEACRKVLKILEYLLQLSNKVYPILIRDTTIISFFANRIMPNFKISHRVIDDNKFIISDLLLILLQTPEVEEGLSGVRLFYKSCGIEVIVETLSSYQNSLPTQIDERQYLMNLFDCLNVMLVSVKQTRQQFHAMKGCYLMISYICNKSQYGVAALKSISNSLDLEVKDEISAAVTEEIVNDGSLKYLFPILMMQGLKGSDDQQQGQINQHILRICYYLIKNSKGVTRDRIIFKFTEKRFAKLQRIFQLRTQNQCGDEKLKKGDITAQQYIKLISQEGLSLVQLCDKIITVIWGASSNIKEKIKSLIPLYSMKNEDIRLTIERNYKFIDQGFQKQYLAKLLATNVREIEEGIIKK